MMIDLVKKKIIFLKFINFNGRFVEIGFMSLNYFIELICI